MADSVVGEQAVVLDFLSVPRHENIIFISQFIWSDQPQTHTANPIMNF